MSKIIAVDFDGTLVTDEYPKIGKPMWKLINWCKKQKALGNTLILWTCRSGRELDDAISYCDAIDLHFDYVNCNAVENIVKYGGRDSRKIYADIYLDDKVTHHYYLDQIQNLHMTIAEFEQKLEDGELVSKDWHDEQVLHLQDENETLKAELKKELVEHEEFTKKAKTEIETQRKIIEYQDGLQDKVDEQKAEIERLTNENGQLNAYVNGLEYEHEEYENMHAEIILLNNEKFELQKKVDELKKDREELFNEMSERMKAEVAIEKNWGKIQTKQAVEDTAKEIIEEIDSVKEIFPNDISGYEQAQGWCMCIDKLKEFIKERYGVEVE